MFIMINDFSLLKNIDTYNIILVPLPTYLFIKNVT